MASQEQQGLIIGVIGAGAEGSALVRKLTKHGYQVRMANHTGKESLKELAQETGARPVEIREIVQGCNILILAIPLKAILELPPGLFDNLSENTIVVDACNYYPSRDGKIKDLEEGLPESVWVSRQIGKPVIKAFNSILAGALEEAGRPRGSPNRYALPISGANGSHKKTIAELVDNLGFDPCDIGSLEESWRQQPGSVIYCTNLDEQSLKNELNSVNKAELPRLRDEAYRKMESSTRELDWKSLVDLLRDAYGYQSSKYTTLESTKNAISEEAAAVGAGPRARQPQ